MSDVTVVTNSRAHHSRDEIVDQNSKTGLSKATMAVQLLPRSVRQEGAGHGKGRISQQ